MTVRRLTKQIAERVLSVMLANPQRMAGRSLILAYHNVVPDHLQGLGDRSLHLPLSAFLRQVDLIQRHCQVKPLAEILFSEPSDAKPSLALTFDDAYRGAVEFALPELGRRGVPSTLFVAPGLLGACSFWWDELAASPEGLTEARRRSALEDQAGNHEAIRSGSRLNPARGPLPECYGCASEEEVRALGVSAHVTLGAHSWSHPNLSRLEGSALAMELTRPLEWLATMPKPVTPVLAYPYGATSPAVEEAARSAGYTGALLVEGGWFTPAMARSLAIPRFNVTSGLSDDGLMLRLSGFFI